MPLDIYPEQRLLSDPEYDMWGLPTLTALFVELETDDGATGLGGPIEPDQAFVIDQQLRPLIEAPTRSPTSGSGTGCTAVRSTAAKASR